MPDRVTWDQAQKALSELNEKQRSIAETRLGQYLVALGSGAAGTRVAGSAVDLMRARYLPAIAYTVLNKPEAWQSESVHVLELVRCIGRLAAQGATAKGQITITCCHVWEAAGPVEEATRVREARKLLNDTSNHVRNPPRPEWCLPPKPKKEKKGGKKR